MDLNLKTITPDTKAQKHKLCKSGNTKANATATSISQLFRRNKAATFSEQRTGTSLITTDSLCSAVASVSFFHQPTDRATDRNHQLSETAQENTSNQSASYKSEIAQKNNQANKCTLPNYHLSPPFTIYVQMGLFHHTLHCPFPKTFGGLLSRQERRSRGVSARAFSSGAIVTSTV